MCADRLLLLGLSQCLKDIINVFVCKMSVGIYSESYEVNGNKVIYCRIRLHAFFPVGFCEIRYFF